MTDAPFITEAEYRRLSDYLYRRTGMTISESRRYFIDRRVAERMEATQSASFASYFARLRSDLGQEIEQFVNAFTVNETYFYREDYQLRCLTADLLRERLRNKRLGAPVRIWSIPCASGEEPFSIAIWLLENWPEVDSHDIEIIASDIDTAALSAARDGVFGKRALSRLTPALVDRYFLQIGDDNSGDYRRIARFGPLFRSQYHGANGNTSIWPV